MDFDFFLFGESLKKRDNFFYREIMFKKLYNQAKIYH